MKALSCCMVMIAALCINACTKNNGGAAKPDTPQSSVPDAFTGNWLSGTFTMSNWQSYNSTQYEANPYTQSVAFTFRKNGDAAFFLALASFDGTCRTEVLTNYEGDIQFNEAKHSFTLYPQQGSCRVFNSCNSNRSFSRPATRDELRATTFYYTMETDNNGREWMVIRFSPAAKESGTYFQSTTW